MKLAALTFPLFTMLPVAALAQSQIPPIVNRIPSTLIAGFVPNPLPATDAIEVIVQTTNPATTSIRVTLTYRGPDGAAISLASERQVFNGFDVHSFNVPAYTVPIRSIKVEELSVIVAQTFTGF